MALYDEVEQQRPRTQAEIARAILHLAGRCDFAASKDNMGFNGRDTMFGHSLADQLASRDLTPKQQQAALKMLGTYRNTQLAAAGIILPTPTALGQFLEQAEARYQQQRQQSQQERQTQGYAQQDHAAPAKPRARGSLQMQGGAVLVRFVYPFEDNKVALKDKVDYRARRWDPDLKAWIVDASYLGLLLDLFAAQPFDLDPAISRVLEEQQRQQAEEERQRQQAEAAHRAKVARLLGIAGDLAAPLPDGRTLYQHQQEFIHFHLTSPYHGTINASEMGTGKTIMALWAARAYQCPIFVICPASVQDNWRLEAKALGLDVVITSYHADSIPEPLEYGPYVVIADEAQAFKTFTAQRTRAALALVSHENCRTVFFLSGTPLDNGRPAELLPLLEGVRHPLAADKEAYKRRYYPAGVTSAAHLDELGQKIKDVLFIRYKKDCLDLPRKLRLPKPIEWTEEGQRLYHQTLVRLKAEHHARMEEKQRDLQAWHDMEQEGLVEALNEGDLEFEDYQTKQLELEAELATKLAQMEGAETLVAFNQLRQAESVAKIEAAVEIARDLLAKGEQVVLFTDFKATAEAVASALGAELMSGDTPIKARQPMVNRFQAGETRALVGMFAVSGLGHTMTAARTSILIDRPWTPGKAEQAEDRLHRIGQTHTVTALWLQAGKIDLVVDALLQKKMERIALVLKGKRKTMQGVKSIWDIAGDLVNTIFGEL